MNLLLILGTLPQYFLKAFQRPFAYFTLLVVAYLCFVLYFFIKRFALMWGQLKRKWNPPAPFEPRLLTYYQHAVWFWSFLLLIGLLMFSFSIYLTSYQSIGSKVQVAGQVFHHGNTVQYIDDEGKQMTASVKGPHVAAAGLFIRFPNWMSWIGLDAYHKLVTFRGNMENEFHYGKKPPAIFLESYIQDPLLLFWYRHAHSVGFAEPSYIESVYFGGSKSRLLVTHSGYIVQSR